KRARHGSPGVLEEPGQAHRQPGGPEDHRAAITEDVPVGLADTEHPPCRVGYFLESCITGCCTHRSPPTPLVRVASEVCDPGQGAVPGARKPSRRRRDDIDGFK